MNCIIVDDEPVARKGMKSLIEQVPQLELAGSFNNAVAASAFMSGHTVDLIFLDIQMPGITGMEFAQSIPENTLVIFTTAYAEYALDSYEVNAVDYLIKPIELSRFLKAVNKAVAYHKLLVSAELQSPNQKIPDRKTKCVIKTHINIKQNVIFGAKLKPV